MSDRSLKLQKRLKSDRICTLIAMGLTVLMALLELIKFIQFGDAELLRNFIQWGIGAACLFILFRLLKRIDVTGKPFDDSTIRHLRAIAFTLLIGTPVAYAVEIFVNMIKDNMTEVHFSFAMPMVAVFIGIISEIFVYGKELQEDNDLIA